MISADTLFMALTRTPIEKVKHIPSESASNISTVNRHLESLSEALVIAYNRIYKLESFHTEMRDYVLALEEKIKSLSASKKRS
jgi:hypothetical protein